MERQLQKEGDGKKSSAAVAQAAISERNLKETPRQPAIKPFKHIHKQPKYVKVTGFLHNIIHALISYCWSLCHKVGKIEGFRSSHLPLSKEF